MIKTTTIPKEYHPEIEGIIRKAVKETVSEMMIQLNEEEITLTDFSKIVGSKTDTIKKALNSSWNLGWRYGRMNDNGKWVIKKYEAKKNWHKRK